MSAYRIGSEFIGSSDVLISVANAEIIPSGKKCYKFSILNQQSCHLIINNGSPIYLGSLQGFNSDEKDCEIYSIKFSESNIQYNYIGAV